MAGVIAIIGDPAAGSVSPAMHRAAFEATGLDLDYVAERVSPDALESWFAAARPRFVGLNVTRPLKEAILPLLDDVGPEAAAAGSVNTVVFRDGLATGRSTDGEGFLAALLPVHGRPPARAVVLGSGGAARAVAAALAGVGTSVVTIGRNAAAGVRMVVHLDGHGQRVRFQHVPEDVTALVAGTLSGCDLLVNATPVGGDDDPAGCPLPPDVDVPPGITVFDLVYRPRRTQLLERALAAGCATIEGVEMLVEQGARSFQLWTGMDAPVDVMRTAAHHALDARAHVIPEPAEVGQPT